jgi:hypothetical protein
MVRWLWVRAALVAAAALGVGTCASGSRVKELSSSALKSVLAPDAAPWLDLNDSSSLLSRILIPRVPGTENNRHVRETIVSALAEDRDPQGNARWHIETPSFNMTTPLGELPMTNIVATRDPHAARKLVLAAHLDSKYYAPEDVNHGFVGATDSAAPMALLVDIARSLGAQLDAYTAQKAALRAAYAPRMDDVTLQLLFLDGEEAFHYWTATDSVYGARALAALWAHEWEAAVPAHPHLAARHGAGRWTAERRIEAIDHFVLLDLLGAKHPSVPHYFDSTRWMHEQLQRIEARLAQEGLLWPAGEKAHSIFVPQRGPSIEDDHLPFLRQGVPVLHLIPYPFPYVWHTIGDDVTALDPPTLHAWSRIMRVFVAEYLDMAK